MDDNNAVEIHKHFGGKKKKISSVELPPLYEKTTVLVLITCILTHHHHSDDSTQFAPCFTAELCFFMSLTLLAAVKTLLLAS